MLGYIVLTIVCAGMLIFSVGATFLATEEKPYRYKLDITDEHEI
jgi:hypothetical protein